MGLTLKQCVDRAGDLSGELKAARELRAVCAADCEAKDHAAALAHHALTNADANIERLEAERAMVADTAHAHILAKGEPPPLADEDPAHNVPVEIVSDAEVLVDANGYQPGHPYFNGLSCSGEQRINDAFDRATHPQDTNGKAVF